MVSEPNFFSKLSHGVAFESLSTKKWSRNHALTQYWPFIIQKKIIILHFFALDSLKGDLSSILTALPICKRAQSKSS